ncbi:MAG: hypothetical protein QOD61_1694 [Solirubrobacteraceae bacterium]|nr:hypothetical protein [Solirubrobacteraceae bacterium]MEA2355565.1 hypothetical protein [Solirubrobacteraceae bacterium]
MSYMNCPRCGLGVRLRASFLTLEHCPRCLAWARLSVPMRVVPGPGPMLTREPPPVVDAGAPTAEANA